LWQARLSAPILRLRTEFPRTTCAHSVLPSVKPTAPIVILRPGAPLFGLSRTSTSLTTICVEAVRVGFEVSVAV
jgi:hypothetical protein